MHRAVAFAIALALLAAPVRAAGPSRCPAPVTARISEAFPKAEVTACKPERDRGRDIFEVKLTRPGGEHLEVDVAADGTILQVEQPIAVDALPGAVKQAFTARYPGARATGANQQTAGADLRYEIAFLVGKAHKEATFLAGGAFVGEEQDRPR